MPTNLTSDRNLINGLSGFWSSFFRDTSQLEAYYRGVQINLGQLYLELLEATLGTSLEHLPVFAKQYYHLFVVGEDDLFYQEGPSPSEDRYVHTPPDFRVAAASCLMNSLSDPQFVLEPQRDYAVSDYGLKFYKNPFTNLTGFPVRTVVKSAPATYRDLLSRAWPDVYAGDTLRLRYLGGTTAFTTLIRGVENGMLHLDSTRPEYNADFSTRGFKVSVLRQPYDFQKHGVQLNDHPQLVVDFGDDVTLVPGTKGINISASSFYQGNWTASTSYTAGDVVLDPGGLLVRAKVDHTAGLAFDTALWDYLTGQYLYINDPDAPANNGIAQVAFTFGAVITVNRSMNFVAGTSNLAKATFIRYGSVIGSLVPEVRVPHTMLDPGSLTVSALRDHDVVAAGPHGLVTYPAGQAVIEGVDFVVDYETGLMRVLSGWDPLRWARASYTWQYEVVTRAHVNRGAYADFFVYNVGDIVRRSGVTYVCVADHFATTFDPTQWTLFAVPFLFDRTRTVKQLALWGADVLYDRDTLYENFGYLLAFRRPSSESYRAFLKGVAQLFVLGPTLGRFTSALNVMAGLPVARDDGEVLRGYNDGIDASGTAGEFLDTHDGRDGVLSVGTSSFTAVSAHFLPSDVGAQIRARVDGYEAVYVVTGVGSATTVTVTPAPIRDAVGVVWSAQHVDVTSRFRTSEHAFSDDDRGAEIWIESAANSANQGRFKIVAVENASTVILESSYPFRDETSVRWKLSRSLVHTITTSRTSYTMPYYVPVRSDVADPVSLDILTFEGFEAFSDAFHVADYISDPTWWHNVQIPKEVLQLQVESAGRRRASPELIEHTLKPLDGAGIGDPGLWIGADSTGAPGLPREGTAQWFGGDYIEIDTVDLAADQRDLGRYVQVTALGKSAQYKLTAIDSTCKKLRLARFPPKNLKGAVPPVQVDVRLPTLLFRRSVGFVMMDQYLKYHSLSISVDPSVSMGDGLLGEALTLLQQAQPSYTMAYLDTPLAFYERVVVADQVDIAIGAPLSESIAEVDNRIFAGGSGLEFDDAYRFTQFTESVPGTVGNYSLSPTLPPAGAPPRTVRFHVVKGWFDLGVLLGGRRIVEGRDYTLNRDTGVLSILTALPGPLDFHYTAVIIRKRLLGDTLDGGETRICLGGLNPTMWKNVGAAELEVGLIDRPVQLILLP